MVPHMHSTADSSWSFIFAQAPLHYSNVQLLDPITQKPVRIGYKFLEDGTKVPCPPFLGAGLLLSSVGMSFAWLPAHSKGLLVRDNSVGCLQVRFTRGKNASGTVVPKSEVLKQRKTPRPPPGTLSNPL